jgi:hypothetical protein
LISSGVGEDGITVDGTADDVIALTGRSIKNPKRIIDNKNSAAHQAEI